MYKIEIISSSVREGRKSHNVALFFKNYFTEKKLAEVEILDLKEMQFPLFQERLSNLKSPPRNVIELSDRIKNADGVIVVTPEYNGGYPASLINVIDVLYDEWYHKPVAIATVSNGIYGGSQVITSLQFVLWKMRALTVPAMFRVSNVHKTFDDAGNPLNMAEIENQLNYFINEFMWCMEASNKMKGKK